MIEIREDLERIGDSQFKGESVLENYFAGAGRGKVLSELKEAIQNGVALMVLTGEEGSGKTQMCRLLEHEMLELCRTVIFSRTVDSFEEVVRIIAMRLGFDTAIAMDGSSVELALEQITDFLLAESVDLLIIFDEAENIYLATLERIRKMLDRISRSGARIHILFSGRDTFLENCDQLSICDFQNTNELHFALAPLTKAETVDYLENWAFEMMEMDATKLLSDEAIDNIYAQAKGNFKKTNILAEESLKANDDETSFMVLLENVKEDEDVQEENHFRRKFHDITRLVVAYRPWIAGAVCGLLVLFFWFSFRENKSGVDQVADQTEQTEVVTVVRKAPTQLPEKYESLVEEAAEKALTVEETKTPVLGVEEGASKSKAVVLMPLEELPTQQQTDHVQEAVEETTNGSDGIGESESLDEVAEKKVMEVVEGAASQGAVPEKIERLALLHPSQELKKEPGSSMDLPRKVIKAQSQAKVYKIITGTKSNSAVELLYNERLQAGLAWKKGKKGDLYTVQLMALASQNAEMNLKKLLTQVNYRQEAGNFYILKNATATDNIFVFYGEYTSIERARLAKSSLPEFLRNHQPYVLKINGAIAKARE